jgi:serine/threonine protein kinase/ABC-type phosphate transport system substrate-binding protein
MSLCINPQCHQPHNSDQVLFCTGCGSEMLLAGKYQAVRLISSQGAFNDTYEITKRGVSKVLKVLKSDNAKVTKLFDQEFRALKNLISKNVSGIPQVKDLFLYSPCDSQQTLRCLVMEPIYGLNLEEYLTAKRQPINEKIAIDWMSQLTNILKQVHSQGILHRDIKPSNIVLQPDGQLVLTDFGAATAIGANHWGQTPQIQIPSYTAPEQHQTGESSRKSDFFSLGRTFVYLLTAVHPMSFYHSYKDALQWRNKNENISPDFLDLIDYLMEEDPEQRPENALDIITAITDLVDPTDDSMFLNPIAQEEPTANIIDSPYTFEVAIEPTYQPGFATRTPTDPTFQSLSITQTPTGSAFQPPLFTPIFTAFQPLINPETLPTQDPRPGSLLSTKWIIPPLAMASTLAFLFALVGLQTWPNKPERFADIKNVPSGDFKVGGSTTWATTRQEQVLLDKTINKSFDKFNVGYVDSNIPSAQNQKCDDKPGSNTGICWLIEGDLDFAQSSVSLAQSKYASEVQKYQLKEEAVAYDALSVVVNPELNISNLTVAQLRNIYSGKITNWEEVGGPNLSIEAFTRDESVSGSASALRNLVLQGEPIGSQILLVNNLNQGLNKVKNSKGGIYYGAAKEVMVDFCGVKPLAINSVKPYLEPLKTPDTCNSLSRNEINKDAMRNQKYPLTRKIYVVTKADGTSRQQAGEAYTKLLLTKQGQEILEKAGFAGIDK